ncbi:MAG: hypothetical protein GXO14_05900 [Thermococci archaeon]|nr:hypothetical protein [Thermococci archaeon]
MNHKKTFSLLLAIILVVGFGLGCITSKNGSASSTPVPRSSSSFSSTSTSSTYTTPTSSTSTWTPRTWTVYNGELTLNESYSIGSIRLAHTTKLTLQLDINSGADSISYIGIIPASELATWRLGSQDITFEFISRHAHSGTYNATLSPGSYYIVVGIADPVYKTLTSGTAVVHHGKYMGIPIDLIGALYATDVYAYINIRDNTDINLGLFSSDEYNVYEEGGNAEPIAFYKKAVSGNYELTNAAPGYAHELSPGEYYLLLDNGYSWFTTKTVDYKVTAYVVYPATISLYVNAKELHE